MPDENDLVCGDLPVNCCCTWQLDYNLIWWIINFIVVKLEDVFNFWDQKFLFFQSNLWK
jgi:hypothetical protein